MTIKDDVKQAAKEQLHEVSDLAKEAATSTAFLYPLKGILYFVSHPALYKSILPIIYKSVGLSVAVLGGMFTLTYLPQVAVFAIVTGPLAFLPAAVAVIAESFFISLFLAKGLFVGQAQEDLFDAVLLQQGHQELVMRGRSVTTSSTGAKKLGKSLVTPFSRFNMSSLVRYLVSLPLNALPVVGTIVFLLYNGHASGPTYHARYFAFKGLNKEEREKFVHDRRGSYTAFGVATLALDLVPVIGLALQFTSTAGAALWASDIEKKTVGNKGKITDIPSQEQRVEL